MCRIVDLKFIESEWISYTLLLDFRLIYENFLNTGECQKRFCPEPTRISKRKWLLKSYRNSSEIIHQLLHHFSMRKVYQYRIHNVFRYMHKLTSIFCPGPGCQRLGTKYTDHDFVVRHRYFVIPPHTRFFFFFLMKFLVCAHGITSLLCMLL